MKTVEFSQADKASMQQLLQTQRIPRSSQSAVNFALARAYESGADWDVAFKLYKQANTLKQNTLFSSSNLAKEASLRQSGYSRNNLHKQAQFSEQLPTPIFIVGLPRAGSTLVEQILASHSEIEGTMEQPVLGSIERKANALCMAKLGKGLLQSVGELSVKELTELGKTYIDQGALFRHSNTPFYTDKQPFNFRHIGLIHKILPHAVIIDIRRNPMDCGLSLFKQYFFNGVDFSYNLSQIGEFYNFYLSLMDHWHSVLPNKVLTVQYEDMVSRPETSIHQILEHVGVPFEDACHSFHNTSRPIHTASSEQVRQPINTRGIGVWKRVENELAPLAKSLGAKTLSRFEHYL